MAIQSARVAINLALVLGNDIALSEIEKAINEQCAPARARMYRYGNSVTFEVGPTTVTISPDGLQVSSRYDAPDALKAKLEPICRDAATYLSVRQVLDAVKAEFPSAEEGLTSAGLLKLRLRV